MRKNRPDTASPWWGDALTIGVVFVIALVIANWLGWLPSFGDSEEAPISVEESR